MAKLQTYRENLTSALGHVLADCDAVAPHTSRQWTDAMLFGLSGGTGHGYILWQFEKSATAPLVLNFVHRWNYPEERLEKAASRSGLRLQTVKTGGAKRADSLLAQAIEGDAVAPLVAVDWLHCPFGWLLQVGAAHDGHYQVKDGAAKPYMATAHDVQTARAASPSAKHRMHRFVDCQAIGEGELAGAIVDGINDAVGYQTSKSASFGLGALRKWQRLLTDETNEKGWPVVFNNGVNLAAALLAVYQRPLLTGSDGAAMRLLYAEFLREADGVHRGLEAVAELYDRAGAAWQHLARAALPDDVPALAKLAKLATGRAQAHARGGADCVDKINAFSAQIADLCQAMDADFPLSSRACFGLFSDMADALQDVIECEQQAIAALQAQAQNL